MTDRIVAGGSIVHLDFILLSCGNEAGVVSYFDRSLSSVKSFGAMLTLGNRLDTEECSVCTTGAYETFIQPVFFGKEKFYHALSIAKGCGTELLMYTKENRGRQFYDFLMKNFDLPLMAEWAKLFFHIFMRKGTSRMVPRFCAELFQ